MTLINAIKNNSRKILDPFTHWEIDKPLSEEMLKEICQTKISDAPRLYDGTRAADKTGDGLDGTLRYYLDKNNIHQHPALKLLVDELLNNESVRYLGSILNKDLSGSFLRIEIIADRNGFWLEPHADIKEKLMSMLLYANPYKESENLGTDFYTSDLKISKTVPYKHNYCYMFTRGKNTLHGLEKKEIIKERRSIQINYVTFETDWNV